MLFRLREEDLQPVSSKSAGAVATFRDPIYSGEVKSLRVYECAREGRVIRYVYDEITPSVWAVGKEV